VYQQSDIVLIPTIHSEGTSLSLIEAMAAKKAVIATYVGGLTDLITDHFNGLMIYPDRKDELYSAIKELITDKTLREYLANNAYQKSLTFDITHWKKKWIEIIASVLNRHSANCQQATNYSLLHMHTPGITFDTMVQRPQQLFKALSLSGVKCFFLEDKPDDHVSVINKKLILAGSHTKVDFSGMILYTYFALNYEIIKESKPHMIIYDVLDTPQIHRDKNYQKNHELMLEKSDILLTSSQLLYEKYLEKFTKKTIRYIPNAANRINNNVLKKPIDFPNYSDKTIGYYGALADWFDYSLLDKLCIRFKNIQMVIIGPCLENKPEYQQLMTLVTQHENLFYLGLKKYEELPHYSHNFNVSIIPFLVNEITQHCSPVKLFEYMNIGAPIVTTDMPECRQYKSALIAKDHEAFISLINQTLTMSKEDKYFKIMRQEAEENTWETRAKLIVDTINENFNIQR